MEFSNIFNFLKYHDGGDDYNPLAPGGTSGSTSNDDLKYTYNVNGKTYVLDFNDDNFGGTYRSDNVFRRGQKKHVAAAVELTLKLGKAPTKQEYLDYLDKMGIKNGRTDGAYENIRHDINAFLRVNNIETDLEGNITTPGIGNPTQEIDPKTAAFNDYYRDIYSLEEGTGGRGLLDRMESAYENAAQQQSALANVQYQQQALQQASTVKAITDQVRAERMARLKSGMSESQIANQDMQMMMANVNKLNQNADLANQSRLEGQLGMNTARDDAYMEWLNQSNARGQNAAAFAASDASDANQTALRYGQNKKKYGAAYTTPYSTVSNLPKSD
jgi:hypothetical protein